MIKKWYSFYDELFIPEQINKNFFLPKEIKKTFTAKEKILRKGKITAAVIATTVFLTLFTWFAYSLFTCNPPNIIEETICILLFMFTVSLFVAVITFGVLEALLTDTKRIENKIKEQISI